MHDPNMSQLTIFSQTVIDESFAQRNILLPFKYLSFPLTETIMTINYLFVNNLKGLLEK